MKRRSLQNSLRALPLSCKMKQTSSQKKRQGKVQDQYQPRYEGELNTSTLIFLNGSNRKSTNNDTFTGAVHSHKTKASS